MVRASKPAALITMIDTLSFADGSMRFGTSPGWMSMGVWKT